MWQNAIEACDPEFKVKGDVIQKLSVIETLPQLLAEDAHSCITRVLPKIQQSLPTASTEFHMAASVIFKQVLEQRLVSPSTFTEVFLHSILSSLESREPVISHAWLETMLDVIELLPVDIIKREILPIAINEGQITKIVNSRITCCRLLGKIATRLDPASVKKDILPTVQILCQDINNDVRACICLQLHYVADSLGDDIIKILPLLVELTNDEESSVRQSAVQTIGHLLPRLKPDTIKDIIIPLIKLTCENAVKTKDNVICVIAQEFGKLAQNSENYLTPADKTWFIKYFIQLAQMGIPPVNVDDSKQDFTFVSSSNVQINDRSVECRRNCAFNIPAMFLFASNAPDGVNSLIPTFRNLANDSYYIVRRTIACSLHEIIKVLGTKSGLVKTELIKLLKDDNEEVLQGLIPHITEILERLSQNQLIGMDQTESSTIELGRALIKCEAEVSLTNNWRLSALMLNQLEVLPKCFPSDFIYTYVVPVVTNRILYSRPLPVRLAAGRTLLILLRYNLKPQQRLELRNQINMDFAHGSSCYLRMVYIRMMIEAMTIFSSVYFKEHFCSTLLSLMEDPVANVRLKVIMITPSIKSSLRLPADKKLLSTLETYVRNLMSNEKDRDVSIAIIEAARQMENIEVRVDSQPSPTKLSRYDAEDIKKYEEEKKIETMSSGKGGVNIATFGKKPNVLKISPTARTPTSPESPGRVGSQVRLQARSESPKTSLPPKPTAIRQNLASSRQDLSKASTSSDNLTTNWSRFTSNNSQLKQSWERPTSCHNTNLTSTNPSYSSANEYPLTQKVHCSCYELADKIFRTQTFSSNLPETSSYHSDSSHCSCHNGPNYLKTTSLFHSKPANKFSDFTKPLSSTTVRDDKHDIWQDLMLTRSSFVSKYRVTEFSNFQSQYNPYWTFSSMPEIPVNLVEDEFMVDAGIRIPSLGSSQSTSKIPNLQDIIFRNKKISGNFERSRRVGTTSFDKSKSFGYGLSQRYSVDYDDSNKPPTLTSVNLSSMAREPQYSSQSSMDDRSKLSNVSPQTRTRFGFEYDHRKQLEDKSQRNSILADKDRIKPLQVRNRIDMEKCKHHSSNYKLPETKESKLKYKQHSMEVPDYNLADHNITARTLRRFSTLDVNHNKGISKIPVRNIHISGSKTAPVTRTSSPIRVDSELFEKVSYNSTEGYSQERRLRRYHSSDEEVDKLCQKF